MIGFYVFIMAMSVAFTILTILRIKDRDDLVTIITLSCFSFSLAVSELHKII